MKKYYIFSINKEFYKVYKENPTILFKTLFNLYSLKLKHASNGLRVYNQLCNTINKQVIENYLETKSKTNVIDNSILEINTSCLILLTKNRIPKKIVNLVYYESPLFVVDFENKNYFWLKKDKVRI
ncbi:MAG: hypothetical protein RSB77_02915 [Bacilli bacterium]